MSGAINKTGLQLRETIAAFLESNFRKIVIDFKKLPPKERVKLYCDLLQYGVPRLQSVSNKIAFEIKESDTDYSKLSDEALNEIIAAYKGPIEVIKYEGELFTKPGREKKAE